MPEPALLDILAEFARLGLISVGGTNYAEMERSLVGEHHWITAATLANGVALGQLMPGPNLLAVTHYGYAVAGWGEPLSSTTSGSADRSMCFLSSVASQAIDL